MRWPKIRACTSTRAASGPSTPRSWASPAGSSRRCARAGCRRRRRCGRSETFSGVVSLLVMDDTARLLVTVLLAAFVIERVVAGAGFLFEKPKDQAKIWRFVGTAILGAIAVWLADIRLLTRLNNNVSPWIDYPLSWLVPVSPARPI